MTVADRIKNRRESLGMTQLQLADKMGYKTKSSISKIESSGDEEMVLKIYSHIVEEKEDAAGAVNAAFKI